ncbi:alpha-mannosidase [Mucilaginibacter sp. PPCGB 2223]|uniref:GH92 family glycosyl hydrolase n=1 Tax=Mucilaginibacter sp. PPCGB 2223 TaxID=1886027 RepID=UPI000825A307|nr:GH92 family glycosyl hydrolase [Mucilaginibacter sp. PPCGB 2223]OCX52276.1 alpha-mannosidase [Mucilaginibacter sp. PPCGB 2223]
MILSHLKRCGVLLLLLTAGIPASAQTNPYNRYVDPFIGSEGQGNVFVGPSRPYGMIKPGPDVNKASNSGYSPDLDIPLYGFSQTHVSGTGGGPKYGNILVMPFAGNFDRVKQESLRANEKAGVGYYSVQLKQYDINAEITSTNKVAFYRFGFKPGTRKAIKFDAGDFLGEKPVPDAREAQQFVGSEIEVVSGTEIRGYSRIRGGWNNGSAYTVYFYAITSKPFDSFSSYKADKLYPGVKLQADDGNKTGVLAYFDDTALQQVQVKIGISFISELKARQNIEEEAPHWSFEKVLADSRDSWEDLLKRVELDNSASAEQKTMFYTGLYHTMLMPVDRSGENPLWQSATPYYDDFYAIWDTFRSSNPLITLIDPAREAAIVNSLLNIYQHDGYMPDARSGNCNGRTQGGSNADVLIADAYVKKLKGINYSLGLEAMLKDATIPPGGNEEKEGRGGLTDYNSLGYVSNRFVRAGNRTVEYAYNDYCLAVVADGLNRKGEARRFFKQADNWKNLWRPVTDHGATGFIMPKDAAGHWIDSIICGESNGRITSIPYTPLAQDWPNCVCWWCGFFYEASSWEYSFYVPHNVAALIDACGGPDAFRQRLDTFFANGYYNVGNEPSFLSPNLYHWIGRPDLSSSRIKQIISVNYNSTRAGLPGNDDSGAMSSWLAFHMLGLYPNAGQSYYLINSPMVKQSVLHQTNGKDFKIIAKDLSDNNQFIQAAFLNGKPYSRSWIEHQDIAGGGELVLQMGPKQTGWGAAVTPPSMAGDH